MTTMDNTPSPDMSAPVKITLDMAASRSALDLVRADFNPAHLSDVGRLNLLTAVLITVCETVQAQTILPDVDNDVPGNRRKAALRAARRTAAMAISHYEIAAMLAVKAATAGV